MTASLNLILEHVAIWILLAAIKSSIILLIGYIIIRLLRNSDPASRFQIWNTCIIGSLAMLVAFPLFGTWQLPVLPVSTLNQEASAINLSSFTASQGESIPSRRSEDVIDGRGQWQMQKTNGFTWILIVWAAGVIVVAAFAVSGMVGVGALKKQATLISSGPARTIVDEMSRAMGITRPMMLLQHTKSYPPFTVGWLRPAILIPAGAQEWTLEVQRSVLAHELAHIQRRDWFFQQITQLCCACFWFNPLVWIARSQLRKERELACDEHVLDSGLPRTEYASHLLMIAREFDDTPRHMCASLAGVVSRSVVEQRVEAILRYSQDRKSAIALTINLVRASLCLAGLAIACATPVRAQIFQAADTDQPEVVKQLDSELSVYWLGLFSDSDDDIDRLISTLDSNKSQVREAAARSLGIRKAPRAVDPLIRALQDPHHKVREAAVNALGRIGDRKVIPHLQGLVDDPHPKIRRKARENIQQLLASE